MRLLFLVATLLGADAGSWSVRLDSFGEAKIRTIKIVRDATGLGLADAKRLVESAPVTVESALDREAAEQLVAKLSEVGAKATALPPGE